MLLAVALTAAVAAVLRLYRARNAAQRELAARRKEVDALRADGKSREVLLQNAQGAITGARIGIVITDPGGAVVEANPAAKHFLGARHGMALAESKTRQLVDAARRHGRAASEELEIRNPMPRTLAVTANPLADTGWVVAYIDDVSDRRKVDAARTDFVANVSHELKTPLGALTLLAETLETATDPAVRQRLITRIGEQAARMSRLVDGILDLSLVEAAGMEPALVDLNKVLAAAAVHVRDIATGAGVMLDARVSNDQVMVLGDERQLISAVGNLLNNAITYTAMAGPPRRVTAEVDVRGGEAVVEVVDTGIGIPAKHQRRIFERFYRVDSARSRETGGSGLGLAIVRHVAMSHGGTVELESESGVGSTFRIVIPVAAGVS